MPSVPASTVAATIKVSANAGVTTTLDLLDTSKFEVTYTYEPVPEPATFGLLGLGFPSMLALRRRRRSRIVRTHSRRRAV